MKQKMITYLDCISREPARKCWNRTYYEDEDELLPLYIHKPNNLHFQNGDSLHHGLLNFKIHQKQDRFWYSRQWNGPLSIKSIQPLQTQHSNTFKPMQKYITAVSSLDEESKWSVHYTAPWHQQENVFLPGSRPPCVEELHCQAKVNLKTVLRGCDKLRKDGFRSSQYYSQGPKFSSPLLSDEDGQLDQDEMEKIKMSPETSSEEEKLVYSFSPPSPYLDNISDQNNHNGWSECLPLPTPEEKMRQHALVVTTDIVPINVTGENFDRQASFRRTIINTDTVIRRSKRIKRRKTITGVPHNIKRELANNEQTGISTQSMKMTGQYSTLGHVESISSSLKHLATCDSGCQTDDIKTVLPSVRKICLQRSSGITTQMANTSLSSSGSNVNLNDCSGNIYNYQYNTSDQGFHSLPHRNNRICVQKSEGICANSPYLSASGPTSSLPCQVAKQPASPDSQHKSDLRKNSPVTSGSDEVHGFQNQNECHTATLSNMPLTHHSSISSLKAAIVLQNARNSSAQTSQSFGLEETPPHSLSSYSSDQPVSSSSSSTSCSASSSGCQSQASLHMATETCSQCSTLVGRSCSPCGVYEDSDMSENSIYSSTTQTTNYWTYKHAPVDQWASSCSSPTNMAGNSLELSPNKTDTSSLFSVDTEEYSTSMQLTPDHKSYSHGCINKAGDVGHNLFREQHSPNDHVSQSNHTLTRSISLRKAKKPPLPPKRTDSLHRKPQRKAYRNDKLCNEQLIYSLHESLTSHSAPCAGQIPISDIKNPWNLCPKSQSSVSEVSSEISAPADVCSTTPTHSDSSSQYSEYNGSWHFPKEYPHSSSEHGLSSQIKRPVLGKENSRDSSNNEIPLSACINSASAEKVQIMTSPSSGYSSQSITPTAGTPVTLVLRTKSPAGRPKPKVPERKSSLRASVSVHSTPVSSNTPDFVKSLATPPSLPKSLPGLVTLQSSLDTSNVSPIMPFALGVSANSEEKQSSSSVLSTIPEPCKTSISPGTSHFTSEASSPLMPVENKPSSSPPPPPPPCPPSGVQEETILKVTNSLKYLDAIGSVKELDYSQSDKPARQERPVITAQALQRVQLRPIKLIKLKNVFTDIITTVCGTESQEIKKEARTCADKPVETEMVKQIITSDSESPLENDMNTTDFLLNEPTATILVSNPASVWIEPVSKTHFSDILELSLDTGPQSTLACTDFLQSIATSCSSNDMLQDQRSPTSPKNSLILHQSSLYGLEHLEDTGPEMAIKPKNINSMSPTYTVIQHEITVQLEPEGESDSPNSTPLSPRRHSVSSEISSDSLTDTQLTGLTLNDQGIGGCDADLGLSDDKGITDDTLSSSSGSMIFKEEDNEDNDAVFDSGTDSSSPTFSTRENFEETMTPARPRTTDDLFAAIHRSKRKVLGRSDFEKEHSRCFITSPPFSPTSSSPSINWMPNQSNNIHRRLHRSTASNDSFKARLLKKGSRSEPGYRMSATEMLKCTDPRLQRSSAEASSPFAAQCTSPGKSRSAYEEWARTEGALPRLSPSLTHSKYGRASTPPCAASSRYNSRSRIPSGPMTVICEREGELAESIDCCKSPFPVSLSSSATLCPQGST